MCQIFTQTAQPYLRPPTKNGIPIAGTILLDGTIAGRLALINLYNLDSHFQRALEGQVSRAEVSWMGDGVWEPESICFDWTNDDFKVRTI